MTTYDATGQAYERHINWGGVAKGAAIVAGVAVAAVVGFWALSALSAAVVGTATAGAGGSALAAGASSAFSSIQYGAGWALGSAVHLLSGIPAGLASILGLTGQHFAQAAAVNHTVGIIGGAAAGVAATHAAIPYIQHGHYVDVDPSIHTDTGVLAAQSSNLAHMPGVVPIHDLSHMTHHAAEHADEHAGLAWSQKFAPRAATYGSFADNVRAQKEERKVVAPSESFTEQLNADRANLDAALAK